MPEKVWPKKDPVIFDLDDTITFGKYKGATIKVLCKHWPSYVNWAANNVEWVRFTPEVYEFLDPYLRETNRLEAVRRTVRRTYTPFYPAFGDELSFESGPYFEHGPFNNYESSNDPY